MQRKNTFFLWIVSTVLFVCLAARAISADFAATVIVLHGDTKKILPRQSVASALTKQERIPEGTTIVTGSQSFVKLLLPDQSQLSIGPDSKMQVEFLRKNNPSVIEVLSGQIRSKITKDVLNGKEDDSKSKFIIKTKAAAIGVRGTEFEVIHNVASGNTSLVTLEGAVAMVKFDPTYNQMNTSASVGEINEILHSDKAVVVTEGRFSGLNTKQDFPSLPVKISPAQLATLKSSDGLAAALNSANSKTASSSTAGNQKYLSPIPPGVNAKDFMSQSIPKGEGSRSDIKSPPPEGFVDKDSGKFAPMAGGFIDLKTGVYVPPPPGSAFDPNTGVFIPPASAGSFDPKSGNYVPPAGFHVDPVQGVVPSTNNVPGNQNSSGINSAQRGIASTNPLMNGMFPPVPGAPLPPPGPALPPEFMTQPTNPVDDPFCPNCVPNPPTTTTVSGSTFVRFIITVL